MNILKDYKKKGNGLGALPQIGEIIRNPNLVHTPHIGVEDKFLEQVTEGLQKPLIDDVEICSGEVKGKDGSY